MPRPRLSILGLMLLVLACALFFAAIRSGSHLWMRSLYSLTVLILLGATLGARFRRGRAGAFWFGFALFGWVYLLIVDTTPDTYVSSHSPVLIHRPFRQLANLLAAPQVPKVPPWADLEERRLVIVDEGTGEVLEEPLIRTLSITLRPYGLGDKVPPWNPADYQDALALYETRFGAILVTLHLGFDWLFALLGGAAALLVAGRVATSTPDAEGGERARP